MFATREQLAQYAAGMRADEALRYLPRFGSVRPGEIDCVIVDGSMAGGFFEQYNTNEMETFEITAVYLLSASEQRSCTPNGNSSAPPSRMRQHWAALIMLRY
jgi:hypothetical protein